MTIELSTIALEVIQNMTKMYTKLSKLVILECVHVDNIVYCKIFMFISWPCLLALRGGALHCLRSLFFPLLPVRPGIEARPERGLAGPRPAVYKRWMDGQVHGC